MKREIPSKEASKDFYLTKALHDQSGNAKFQQGALWQNMALWQY